MMVPLQAGNSGAVIDSVVVVGGAGYGGPRVLSVLEVRQQSRRVRRNMAVARSA